VVLFSSLGNSLHHTNNAKTFSLGIKYYGKITSMENEEPVNKIRLLNLKNFIIFVLLVAVATLSILLYFQIFQKNPNKAEDELNLVETKEAKAIFGNLNPDEKKSADGLIREQVRLIITRPQFYSSLEVVKKNEEIITHEAEEKQIPKEVAIGMAVLENGGSESAVSSAGAAGIFQITEGTAKTLGLEVSEDNDERLDPQKNITAGISYLNQNLKLFSDIGLAVWAYHAGPQNVSVALKTYLESIGEKDAFDYLQALEEGKLDRAKYVWRAYATKGEINIHRLLQNPKVQLLVLARLGDETELYPYKVAASSIIWQTRNNYQPEEEFKQKITEFNQGRILLSDLLSPKKVS